MEHGDYRTLSVLGLRIRCAATRKHFCNIRAVWEVLQSEVLPRSGPQQSRPPRMAAPPPTVAAQLGPTAIVWHGLHTDRMGTQLAIVSTGSYATRLCIVISSMQLQEGFCVWGNRGGGGGGGGNQNICV